MQVQILQDYPEHLIFQEIPDVQSLNKRLLDFVKLEAVFWFVLLVLFFIIKLLTPGLSLANLMMVWMVVNLLQTFFLFIVFLFMTFSESMAKKYPIDYTLWELNRTSDLLKITHKTRGLNGEVTELPLHEFESSYVSQSEENSEVFFLYFLTPDGDPIEIEESSNFKKLNQISQLVNRFLE